MFSGKRGLFGASLTKQPPLNPVPAAMPTAMPTAMPASVGMAMPEAKPGIGTRLLGEGWEGKVSALGGLLAGDQSSVARYHHTQKQEALAQQQAAAAQAADLRNRSLDRQDWLFEKQWERSNPQPTAPDAFERALAGANIDPTSEQGQSLFRARAESMARDPNDEFVVVPIPGRGTYAGPRSGMRDALGGAPQSPVGQLTPITGGTAGNGGGGF